MPVDTDVFAPPSVHHAAPDIPAEMPDIPRVEPYGRYTYHEASPIFYGAAQEFERRASTATVQPDPSRHEVYELAPYYLKRDLSKSLLITPLHASVDGEAEPYEYAYVSHPGAIVDLRRRPRGTKAWENMDVRHGLPDAPANAVIEAHRQLAMIRANETIDAQYRQRQRRSGRLVGRFRKMRVA